MCRQPRILDSFLENILFSILLLIAPAIPANIPEQKQILSPAAIPPAAVMTSKSVRRDVRHKPVDALFYSAGDFAAPPPPYCRDMQ